MKIAYMGIKGLPSKSGTERVVEAIVKRLCDRHEITVYCDWKYTPANTHFPGVRLIRMPSIPGKYTRSPSLFIASAFHALLSGKFDLIHMHGIDACFTLPLLRLRYKIISTSHQSATLGHREKWGKFAQSFLEFTEIPFCHLSHYATSVSSRDVALYQSRYQTKVAYIPNGVDEDMPCDTEAAQAFLAEYRVQPGEYLLFAAGRIDPSKGCHLAIEAYNRIQPVLPLLVVGDFLQVPSYSDSLRRLAAASDGRIVFVPLISEKALLYGILKDARLFIFPSLNEGMSIMLLEAASMGTPVICSDIAENRAILKDDTLYFQSGDAADLADRISWALEHPEQASVLAQRAKEWVNTHLAWSSIVSSYEQLYERCVRGDALPDLAEEWLV